VTRVLLIGLDCLVPDVLDPPAAELMPTLSALGARGISGVLQSTLPPITVPAWTSMLTGRDPGELGLYGFRNRHSVAYGDFMRSTSTAVRRPRIWDRLTAAGRASIVVGVPQTSPPPAINGVLISGFEGPVADGAPYTFPPELAGELPDVVGGPYLFDVPNFRRTDLAEVAAQVETMTKRRFHLMRHLLRSREWDFAMLHEIGPDRMHHCFWQFHDHAHPHHDPGSPFRNAIARYYRQLDAELAALLADIGSDVAVLVASDHGACAMQGGVAVNDVLRQAGLLVLHREPTEVEPLDPAAVDWSRTVAWAEGGYYARIFLNLRGRELDGVVALEDRAPVITRIRALFERLDISDGRVLVNYVAEPRELYRSVRGLAPDLMIFFAEESWRSLGTVGHTTRVEVGNDTGADGANHSRNGMFALHAPGRSAPQRRTASILDVTPTLLDLLGLPADPDLTGASMLASPVPAAAGICAP